MARIAEASVATGATRTGGIGKCPIIVVEAAPAVRAMVTWLEARC